MILVELWRPERPQSGAPFYRNGTRRMHRNRNPYNSFLIAKMASGMDHGHVRLATTNDDDDDVAQHDGHPANAKSCSLGLQHIYLFL